MEVGWEEMQYEHESAVSLDAKKNGISPCDFTRVAVIATVRLHHFVLFIAFGQSCKPGSVLDDHLSRLAIADKLQRPTFREAAGNCLYPLFGLAPDGVYTADMSPCRR